MSSELSRLALNGATMGTRWSALTYAPATTDAAALQAALAGAVDLVDRQMSTWKPTSDLMRLNAAPLGVWVPLPAELLFVVAKGLAIGRASDGAFDIGLGDLVDAWGFGPGGSRPDAAAVQSLLSGQRQPTHAVLELDETRGRVRKHAELRLDLSGIAKGFGVDEMMRVARSRGLDTVLVALDGELRACGAKPDGTPWAVAVEKPDYDRRSTLGVVALQDAAIATSGDYRRWVDVGPARLSHTMDRRRGGPLRSPVASVTVIAESCVEADAWATALLVLGPTEGSALASRCGLEALFVLRTDRGLSQVPVGTVFQAAAGGA